MKRRDFLTHTAGIASILATGSSRAEVTPCPPPLEGGTENCPVDNPPLGGAPSWFTNAAEGVWFEVPGSTTPRPVDLGVGYGQYAYTGAGVNQQRKEYTFTCAGGHTDSGENGVYALQLNQETPAWVTLVEYSLNADTNDLGNTGDAAYADGTPRSIHGWNQSGIPVGDSIWLPAMTGTYQRGRGGSQVWELDRAAITNPPVSQGAAAASLWTFHGHGVPDGPMPNGMKIEGSGAAYDSNTGLIWSFTQVSPSGEYPIWSIDTTNGDIQQYPTWPGGKWPKAGTNHVLNRAVPVIVDSQLLIWSRYSTSPLYRLDLTNVPGVGLEVVTESGTRPDMDRVAAHYHAATNRIYVYKFTFGSTMYYLDVPTNPKTGTYTWGSFQIGGTAPTGGSTGGYYSHFNLIQDMGDGQGALIINTSFELPTYMYKLPTS